MDNPCSLQAWVDSGCSAETDNCLKFTQSLGSKEDREGVENWPVLKKASCLKNGGLWSVTGWQGRKCRGKEVACATFQKLRTLGNFPCESTV